MLYFREPIVDLMKNNAVEHFDLTVIDIDAVALRERYLEYIFWSRQKNL